MSVCLQPGCPKLQPCPDHKPQPMRSPSSKTTGTRAWRNLRAKVLKRDHYRCVRCPRPAIHVHHTQPIALGGEGLPDMDTLMSLCAIHHAAAHRALRRKKATR